jgi:hypothetical protein
MVAGLYPVKIRLPANIFTYISAKKFMATRYRFLPNQDPHFIAFAVITGQIH